MSEQIGGEGTEPKPKSGNQNADGEGGGPAVPTHGGGGPRNNQPRADPPNWIEKGTFFVLVATFLAAAAAAFEGDRLARDTEAALSDARLAALQAHLDNANAENLAADSIGQAQRNSQDANRTGRQDIFTVIIGSLSQRLCF